MMTTTTTDVLMRLPAVLQVFPVSRSGWYEGVRTGRYPAPVKLGARAVAWRRSDIERLVANGSYEPVPSGGRA
ncbi:phage transcriptional regulator, AlpA [[Acidovorax] ebreus TPSY]|uniref:Phage transcriptional regulator, AlpA n=2 Tax=Diaphorobacter TaxID=238749 RepID=A0A9J9UBL7_ACIET|nr:phage transcriptional regulator, AlpA [[Acidovorax] ebreus TPSY]